MLRQNIWKEVSLQTVRNIAKQYRYLCESSIQPSGSAGFSLIQFFPYIEGLSFVKDLMSQGGWDAVNQAYTNVPESTEQIIHPEKYRIDRPTNVTVADRSLSEWTILVRDTIGDGVIFDVLESGFSSLYCEEWSVQLFFTFV